MKKTLIFLVTLFALQVGGMAQLLESSNLLQKLGIQSYTTSDYTGIRSAYVSLDGLSYTSVTDQLVGNGLYIYVYASDKAVSLGEAVYLKVYFQTRSYTVNDISYSTFGWGVNSASFAGDELTLVLKAAEKLPEDGVEYINFVFNSEKTHQLTEFQFVMDIK